PRWRWIPPPAAPLPRGGLGLRREAQHPAPARRPRLRSHRGARAHAGVGGAGARAGRRVPLQRPRRPGALRLRHRGDPRGAGRAHPPLRHLPGPPAAGARRRRAHGQDGQRPPWRQPPGAGPRRRPGHDHLAEPRVRGGRSQPAWQCARDPPLAVRRHQPGHRAHRRAGLQLPGPPRGRPRPARRAAPLRPLHRADGGAALMPRRTDIQTILIIGAGPIVIGQACEFDYSGAQACKALREEGYRVVLVNSNPATIMTDPDTADAVYIEPINWQTVEKIIAKEKPDALLPTMGGQTALNCALDLADNGVLEKYG